MRRIPLLLAPLILTANPLLSSMMVDGIIDGPPAPAPPATVSRDDLGRVTLRAIPIDTPVLINGLLEEDAYRQVAAVDGFIQQEPHEGEPATERTEVWIFFDHANVYIAARCWDSRPESIVANEMRRDSRNIFENDNFTVVLDTFYDRRNGFLFETNPLGALYDAQITDEQGTNKDWNTVWDVKTSRFAAGWTLEMAIPFKSLRYRQETRQLWGINFRRIVRSKNEWSYLTPMPASYRDRGVQKLSQAATLVGIEAPERALNLEGKPYLTLGLQTDAEVVPEIDNELDSDIGLDIKYGLTKSLVADLTVNTDFAQVEVDDQQINLSRFSLYFPEKREFFLDGKGLFDFGGRQGGHRGPGDVPVVFYSRRIGLQDEYQVPIQAGVRLTGRAGKYTLGMMDIGTGAVDEAGIPATNYSVVRVKRDILRRSYIGVIATHRNHSVENDDGNTVYGLDAGFSFLQDYTLNAYFAQSQSPDRDGDDQSYMLKFDYTGDLFGYTLSHLVVGESFNPEIGFVRRQDFRKSSAGFRYSPRPKALASVRKLSFRGSIDSYTNLTGGYLEAREAELRFITEFNSGDEVFTEYGHEYERLDEEFELTSELTIPAGEYESNRVFIGYELGPQRRVSGFCGVSLGDFYGGTRNEIEFWGRVEVTSRFSLDPGFSMNWIDLPGGKLDTTLMRLRGYYSISARSYIGAFLQYSTESSTLSTNIRFRWEYRPGSDLYLVYTDSRDTAVSGSLELQNRSLVVKLTRLFRL